MFDFKDVLRHSNLFQVLEIMPFCLSFPGSDPTVRLLAVLALEAMGPEIVYEQEAHATKLSVKKTTLFFGLISYEGA